MGFAGKHLPNALDDDLVHKARSSLALCKCWTVKTAGLTLVALRATPGTAINQISPLGYATLGFS